MRAASLSITSTLNKPKSPSVLQGLTKGLYSRSTNLRAEVASSVHFVLQKRVVFATPSTTALAYYENSFKLSMRPPIKDGMSVPEPGNGTLGIVQVSTTALGVVEDTIAIPASAPIFFNYSIVMV